MRRIFHLTIVCAGLLAGRTCMAEIVDRIAVSVGNRVITQTDLDREIRITALLNGEKPDFSPANKRRTIERMVDQWLVRSELEASRYLLPTGAEAAAELQQEKNRFADDAAYRRALAGYGVTEQDLKDRLLWQLTLIRFIDLRFRPGIQIGDEEIRKYFDEHVKAAATLAHPVKTPALADYRDSIERMLISQAADEQVEQWLKEARRRTRIIYHEEVLQ
ncbi:MAG TPA: hypothetical protein VMT86_22140 [Bryobacteraceae bacterium]|nr:hypothetical protein [Bryobacteraceae bacterium]